MDGLPGTFPANRGVAFLASIKLTASLTATPLLLIANLATDMSASCADQTTRHSTKPASLPAAGYARRLALHPEIQNFERLPRITLI